MSDVRRWKVAMIALAIVLVGAVVGDVLLYRRAARPLVEPGTEALVASVRSDAARLLGTSVGKKTFAISMSLADRTCVELRPLEPDGRGYLECRGRNGRTIEERTFGGGF